MNKIEKLAVTKLKESLYSAAKRCVEENENRMQHERIFLLRDINEALGIINAIEENDSK
jgi:hypothetical protein